MAIYVEKYVARILSIKLRFRLMFVGLVALCLLGLIITYHGESNIRMCFMAPAYITTDIGMSTDKVQSKSGNTLKILDDVLIADIKPKPGRSIFFHETSCHRTHRSGGGTNDTPSITIVQSHMLHLNARQACAIESAALHNPNLSVFVLFASAVYNSNNTKSPVIDALLTYPNIHFRNLNLSTYASGTPINDWFNRGDIFRSDFVLSHLSDFLRYLTLWRYGGLYLDLDVIILRSMEDLPPNYTGAESQTDLAAGVMSFAADGFGHEIAFKCLNDFQRNFVGNIWGNNGPGVITRVMLNVCGVKNVANMLKQKNCKGFRIFESSAFYAVPYKEWNHFFEAQYLQDTLNRTQNSYVVHVWNKLSAIQRVKVGSKTAYGQIAEKHCPKVYRAAGDYF